MGKVRIISVPATLEGVTRLKDKSINLRFNTVREITTDELGIMDTYFQNTGWLAFRENEFKDEEIPTEDIEVDTEKSQSVQVRDALWVLYRALGYNSKDKDAWNRFYREKQQAFKHRILTEVHKIEESTIHKIED